MALHKFAQPLLDGAEIPFNAKGMLTTAGILDSKVGGRIQSPVQPFHKGKVFTPVNAPGKPVFMITGKGSRDPWGGKASIESRSVHLHSFSQCWQRMEHPMKNQSVPWIPSWAPEGFQMSWATQSAPAIQPYR